MKARMDVMCVVVLVVVVGGNEFPVTGEAIHDEVAPGRIDPTVKEGGDREEQAQNESGACAHRAIVDDA
jgi:hypothetical protein